MSTRNYSLSFIILLLLQAIVLPAQNTSKTFTKSFNTQDKGTIRLDLPGMIDLKIWDNAAIRIDIGISLPGGSASMLNELANVGRYNLVATPVDLDDALVISAPNLQKQLKVKGEVMKEAVVYTVFLPKNLKVEMPGTFVVAQK